MRIEGLVKEYIVHRVWVDVGDIVDDELIDGALVKSTIREVDNSQLRVVTWKEVDTHE